MSRCLWGRGRKKKTQNPFFENREFQINENSYIGAPLSGRMLKLLLTDGEIVFFKKERGKWRGKPKGEGANAKTETRKNEAGKKKKNFFETLFEILPFRLSPRRRLRDGARPCPERGPSRRVQGE